MTGEWIGVKERLPELGQIVLVARAGDPYPVVAVFNQMYGESYLTELWPIKGTNITDRVTHWMELPAVPGEETR